MRPLRSRLRGTRFWVVLLSLIGVSLILFLVIRIQGHVAGKEFSPGHFQQRSFDFFEIPLIHLQVTPINRSSATSSAANYIRQKNLISVPAGQPNDWHLVTITRGISDPVPADAQLLTDQLAHETGDGFWRKWSESHPQQAATLWPLVQKLAQRELYVLIPRLLELAHQSTASPDFEARLHAYLREEYAALVAEARRAERPELASDLLQEGLADYPGDATLRELSEPADALPLPLNSDDLPR